MLACMLACVIRASVCARVLARVSSIINNVSNASLAIYALAETKKALICIVSSSIVIEI